jgi:alkylhydroperoxidase/carboxymuconolactone decarboxylase family protein YurZ
MSDGTVPTADQVLAQVRAKRGYLLSYHKLLGHNAPGLLAAYDAFYQKLTLDPRSFTEPEREIVWAGLLVAAREAHGALHMRRARAAGLAGEQLAMAVAIAAATDAWVSLAFAPEHWSEWIPESAARPRYVAMFEAARGELPAAIAETTACVCHAARRQWEGLAFHLPRAFASGATVPQMAEGLSYLLLPCGGPTLIDAVETWARTAAAGACPAPFPDHHGAERA